MWSWATKTRWLKLGKRRVCGAIGKGVVTYALWVLVVVLWSDQAGDETFGAGYLPCTRQREPKGSQRSTKREDTKRIPRGYMYDTPSKRIAN